MTAEILKFQPRSEKRSKADSVFSPIIAQETIYAQDATRNRRGCVRSLRNSITGSVLDCFLCNNRSKHQCLTRSKNV